uniref:Variant-specific surface protein n=1 Tax=Strongyloides papillosus TaxID=174720 RepID=A0A0N5C7Z7_STREA
MIIIKENVSSTWWITYVLFFFVILPFVVTDGSFAYDIEPTGLNVCIFEEEVKIHKPEKVVIDDVVKYPMKEFLVKKNVSHCCIGFYQNLNNTCTICNEGTYGRECRFNCGECQGDMICNNVVGCTLDPLLAQKSRFKKYFSYGLLALVGAVSLLVFLVMYYRKKYKKEKDPSLPTVVFHDTKGQDDTEEGVSMEIKNPLYNHQAFIEESEKNFNKQLPNNDDEKNKYEIPGDNSNIYTSIPENRDDSTKSSLSGRSENTYSDWVYVK